MHGRGALWGLVTVVWRSPALHTKAKWNLQLTQFCFSLGLSLILNHFSATLFFFHNFPFPSQIEICFIGIKSNSVRQLTSLRLIYDCSEAYFSGAVINRSTDVLHRGRGKWSYFFHLELTGGCWDGGAELKFLAAALVRDGGCNDEQRERWKISCFK